MNEADLDYEPTVTEVIAFQNDLFRTHLGNHPYVKGKVLATSGVSQRGPQFLNDVAEAVRTFSAFNKEDDPHGEHNFGVIYVAGVKLYFRIDLYDPDYRFGSNAPHDLTATRRVLTVMHPQDY